MDETNEVYRGALDAWTILPSRLDSGVLTASCVAAIGLTSCWIVYSQVRERVHSDSVSFSPLAIGVLFSAGVVLAFSVLHPLAPVTWTTLDGRKVPRTS